MINQLYNSPSHGSSSYSVYIGYSCVYNKSKNLRVVVVVLLLLLL